MAYQDLRDYLSELDREGDLLQINDNLDPRFELSAFLRVLGKKESPAVRFNKVNGYNTPVVGNIFGSKKRVSRLFEVEEKNLLEEYLARKNAASIPPKMVKDGPVKERIVDEAIDIPATLPVLTYHEGDVSPYITQGIVLLKDPESENQTMGIHRLQVRGKDQLRIYLGSKTSTEFLLRAERRGEPMEVAVALGMEPMTVLSAVAWFPFGDKFALAGTLRKEPVELIRAEKVNLKVPAQAMVILEGTISSYAKEKDGPFGESWGYPRSYLSPTIDVKAVTHQKDFLYTVTQPWTSDDDTMMAVAFGAEIFHKLKQEAPSICGINFTSHSGNAIISVKKISESEIRRIIYLALTSFFNIKQIIVVDDDDVDIHDPKEVEWALITRFQADKDLVLVSGLLSFPLDPSEQEGSLTTKMGFDATKPLGEEEKYARVRLPRELLLQAEKEIAKII